jgi:D-alanyl-D-alanine carboxypeptidase
MKTGFICAGGFNVVATATRNGKRLIAVVLGAPSPAVRAVKAAQLFERGFQVRPLTWLTPGLGQVEALQPTNVDPPNLREQMCGKHRRRPPSEEAENDPLVEGSADSPYAVFLSTLRGPNTANAGPLLQDVKLGDPVRVFLGPPNAPIDHAPGAEAKAKAKAKTKTAKKPAEAKTEAGSSGGGGPTLANSSSSAATADTPRPAAKKPAAKKAATGEAKATDAKKDGPKNDAAAKVNSKAKTGTAKSSTASAATAGANSKTGTAKKSDTAATSKQ